MEEVCLKAPIPYPKQDVICLGINYMAHAEESARYKKEAFGGERPFAVYFSKRVNRATGTGEEIPGHRDLVQDPTIRSRAGGDYWERGEKCTCC